MANTSHRTSPPAKNKPERSKAAINKLVAVGVPSQLAPTWPLTPHPTGRWCKKLKSGATTGGSPWKLRFGKRVGAQGREVGQLADREGPALLGDLVVQHPVAELVRNCKAAPAWMTDGIAHAHEPHIATAPCRSSVASNLHRPRRRSRSHRISRPYNGWYRYQTRGTEAS